MDCEESCRPRVIQGCTDDDPYYCVYKWRADLVPPAGLQGGADGRNPYGVDPSYIEIPDKGRFILVSAKNSRNAQSIQIGPVNTTTWTVASWHVISEPDQPWERNTTNSRPRDQWVGNAAVNEGPHVSHRLSCAGVVHCTP